MKLLFALLLTLSVEFTFAQNYLLLTNKTTGKAAKIKQGWRIEFQVRTGDPNTFPPGVYNKGVVDLVTDSIIVINGFGVPLQELMIIRKNSPLRQAGRIIGTTLAPITLRIGMLGFAIGGSLAAANEPVAAAVAFGGGVIFTAFSIIPYFLEPKIYDLDYQWQAEPVILVR